LTRRRIGAVRRTLVDVTGLVTYFSVGLVILRTLL
jgi:hypothetical protein